MTYSTVMMAYCLQQTDLNADCSPPSSAELNQTAKTFFPKVYYARKQSFQGASCEKWPLPSCRKRFHTFWGEKVFVEVGLLFISPFVWQSVISSISWQWILRMLFLKRHFSSPLDMWKTCVSVWLTSFFKLPSCPGLVHSERTHFIATFPYNLVAMINFIFTAVEKVSPTARLL